MLHRCGAHKGLKTALPRTSILIPLNLSFTFSKKGSALTLLADITAPAVRMRKARWQYAECEGLLPSPALDALWPPVLSASLSLVFILVVSIWELHRDVPIRGEWMLARWRPLAPLSSSSRS